MDQKHIEDTLRRLERWIREAPGGYMHSGVCLSSSEVLGVHWRSRESLSTATQLFTVPHSHALSYLNALVDDAYPVFRARRKEFKLEAIGRLYLALQHINKDKSFWKPYLDTLPAPGKESTTPIWFEDPGDIALLEGTDVWHASAQREAVYKQQYDSGLSILKQAGVDVSELSW